MCEWRHHSSSSYTQILKTLTMLQMADKNETFGALLSLFIMSLYTIGAIAVQALDKSIPVFQLNMARLTGNVHPLPMTGAIFSFF